jgi:hypothetical protein
LYFVLRYCALICPFGFSIFFVMSRIMWWGGKNLQQPQIICHLGNYIYTRCPLPRWQMIWGCCRCFFPHHRIRLIRNYMSFNDLSNIRFNNILLASSVYQLI